jgi:hypothetical protein
MTSAARIEPIRVIHFGLGPIGIEVAKVACSRAGLLSVGAIDVNPHLAGRRLADLVDSITKTSVVVNADTSILKEAKATVALHCTGSSAAGVKDQVLTLVQAGLNVISTCEELAFPWAEGLSIADELDEAARHHGVTVLGTGVNPGFAMDFLPIAASGAMRRVDSVSVHRVQDAGSRRLPLQAKVGICLNKGEFATRVRGGTLGHVGLPESARALADAFGWRLSRIEQVIEPVLAVQATSSALGPIAIGHVTGLYQTLRAWAGKSEVIHLVLEMAIGLPNPRDEIHISGDASLRVVVPGGIHGDVATAAIVVNSIPQVVAARPGLVTVADLPPAHPWGAGAAQHRESRRNAG